MDSHAQPPPIPPSARATRAPEDDPAMRMLLPIGRSGWAILAGYLGLFSVLMIPAPFAIAASIVAIREVRRTRGTPKPRRGLGRAVFGLVMGTLGTLALIGAVISAIARPA